MNFMRFSLLLVSAGAVSLETFAPEGLVNQQVKRIVYLSSPILREEYSIVVALDENTAGPVHNYQVIIPPSTAPNFSHINAIRDNGNNSKLPVSEKSDCAIGHRCFVINFPVPLTKSNPKVTFGLGISYVGRFITAPLIALQKESPGMRCELSPYFYSPYPTLRQKTEVLVVKEFTMSKISCPEPRNLKASAVPAGSSLPGTFYTCGIYENILPLHENYGEFLLYFKIAKIPFFKLKKLERTVEVSPLRKKLLVTEDYEINSLAHDIKDGGFSRTEWLQDLQKRGLEGHILPFIPISVPSIASDFKVRDEVGLIHSPMHRRASPVLPNSHVYEVPPRFPLGGGWSLAWSITYSLPMEEYVDQVHVKEEDLKSKRMIVPLFELFNDVAIDDFTFRIILPPGSITHGAPIITSADNFITGRSEFKIPMAFFSGKKQVFTITFKNVVKEHLGQAAVLFDYPRWTPFRLPIMTIVITILITLLLTSLSDANLGLHPVSREKKLILIAKLLQERRFILQKLDATHKDKAFTKNHMEELNIVSREINQVLSEGDFFDRSIQAAILALKKLYEEQFSKLKALLNEASTVASLRLEKDAIDLDERVLHCEARILSF